MLKKDADTKIIDVEKCGLCGGELVKRANFKDSALRLVAEYTARNIKRG